MIINVGGDPGFVGAEGPSLRQLKKNKCTRVNIYTGHNYFPPPPPTQGLGRGLCKWGALKL